MHRVGIFWDYENCKLPPKMSGYTVVGKIRQAALPLGGVSLFKAYMDVNSKTAEANRQDSEMQNSGVSLVHIPLSAKKEVIDKILLVDLLVFAFENQGPATIILITADNDITYALSVLRLRGHQIIIISPAESAYCQGDTNYPADSCLDWKLDVLESDDPAAKTRYLSTRQHSWRAVAEGCVRAQPAESGSAGNFVCSQTKSVNKGGVYSSSSYASNSLVDKPESATRKGPVTAKGGSVVLNSGLVPSTEGKESAFHDKAVFHADIENPRTLQNGNPADKTWGISHHANAWETVDFAGLNVRGDGMNNADADAHVPPVGILPAVEESLHETSYTGILNLAETVPASPEERFKVLVEVLMNQQKRGYSFTSSADLGNILLQADPKVYEGIGVSGLKEYLELARQENVILFFGSIQQSKEVYVFLRRQHTPGATQQTDFASLLGVLKVWAGSGCKQVPFGLLERHILGLNPDAAVRAGAIDFRHYVLLAFSAGLVRVDLPALSWIELVRQPSPSGLAWTSSSSSQSFAWADSATETAAVRSVQTAPTVYPSVSSSTPSKTVHKVDRNFATLVDMLREKRERGVYEVKRGPLVKMLLKRDPQSCHRMGIETNSKTRIKDYVAKALAAGIIVLGKGVKGGKKTAQLHPNYY
ncbi:hypothetical protein M0805_008280 [Coniferiporia weirii]|nr:hypothetical protein M0805_008280 [Coniferiporia weirii]